MQVFNNSDASLMRLCDIAMRHSKIPASNGHNERTMNSIKQQHTPIRSLLNLEKLLKLIYIQNNEKLLSKFQKTTTKTNLK